MRVLLIGGGGREVALAHALTRSPRLSELWVQGENPGWPTGARCSPDGGDAAQLAATLGVDLVVVGPEAPLAGGLADRLQALGIPCFGPSAVAARLESSKSWAKQWLLELGISTASAIVLEGRGEDVWERASQRCARGDVVIKVDGLAGGKGSLVCASADEAMEALESVWSGAFGTAAERILLEDRLTGPEVSVFALCDGARAVPLPACHDYKRLADGDLGPNTGGMGAVCPSPRLSADEVDRLVAEVHQPVVSALASAGVPFRGVLYAGIILHEGRAHVLEFNVRFGDPETQALLACWEDDPLPWLHGAAVGALPPGRPRFSRDAAVCVVMAAPGYPGEPLLGERVTTPGGALFEGLIPAGLARDVDGELRSSGGRVLSVVGRGRGVARARDAAYDLVGQVSFPGAQWRRDVGLA